MNHLRKIVVFLFVFQFAIVSAQSYLKIDTVSYQEFHQYEPLSLHALTFGSAGSVYRSLLFDTNSVLLNQSVFFNKKTENLPSFNVKVPVVDAKYITGASNEQHLSVFHTQNINPRLNYALLFTKKSYDGYYSNQLSNHNFFQSNISFSSKNKTYKGRLFYNYHRYFLSQNGGVQNDSAFINDVFSSSNRLLLGVNLDNAFSKDILHHIGLTQSFLIANRTDSLSNKKSQQLNVGINVSTQSKTYFDSLQDQFYAYSYYDTLVTKDTLGKNMIEGKLAYHYAKDLDSLSKLLFTIGTNGQIYSHDNLELDTGFYNLSSNIDFAYSKLNSNISLHADYFFSGYRNRDYHLLMTGSRSVKKWNIDFKLDYLSSTPSFELQRYRGNHSFWNNSFEKQNVLTIQSALAFKKWKLSGNYIDVKNPIYFDYLAAPVQNIGFSQIIQTSIAKQINVKGFNFEAAVVHQYQGGYLIYQLPKWVGLFDCSYSFNAFKSALNLNVGIQGKLFSEFLLMDYRPDLSSFYVSNQSAQQQYINTDFYLNARIKTVNFFFLISHLNAGLTGYNYFTALHYPSPDRYFKLGLRWMFLN